MGRHDLEPYAMYPDNCERCAGMMGGVRGNENRYPDAISTLHGGYRVLCDYCSCEVDEGLDREIICQDCTRPLSVHVLMKIEQIEAIWEQGISLTICGGEPSDYPTAGTLALVAMENDKPADPCDEDYMKEISS